MGSLSRARGSLTLPATAVLGLLAPQPARGDPTGSAFIVSGGRAAANYCSMEGRLSRANDTLSGWNRFNFYNDGEAPAGTPGTPNAIACRAGGHNTYDRDGRPVLTRARIADTGPNPVRPANLEEIRSAFRAHVTATPPPSPVLFYIHNHGSGGEVGPPPIPPYVTLWNGERITVEELRTMLNDVPSSSRVVLVSDSCHGGHMLDAMFDSSGRARTNVCGFSPASSDEYAWDDELFIDAANSMARQRGRRSRETFDQDHDGNLSFGEVHRYMRRSYFASNSTPVSTGEVFLQRYVQGANAADLEGGRSNLLSHCLFTERGASQVAGLASALSSAPALLQLQAERLRSDLGNDYAGAGIPSSTSYADVAARLETRRREQAEADEAENTAFEALRPVLNAYVAEQLGTAEFGRYSSLSSCLQGNRETGSTGCETTACRSTCFDSYFGSQVPASSAGASDPTNAVRGCVAGCGGGDSACRSGCGEAEVTRLMNERDRLFIAAKSGESETFRSFVRNGSTTTPRAWDRGVLRSYRSARSGLVSATTRYRSLRRLDQTLRSVNALERMVGDAASSDPTARARGQEAIVSYLQLLDCENTPIRSLGLSTEGGGS